MLRQCVSYKKEHSNDRRSGAAAFAEGYHTPCEPPRVDDGVEDDRANDRLQSQQQGDTMNAHVDEITGAINGEKHRATVSAQAAQPMNCKQTVARKNNHQDAVQCASTNTSNEHDDDACKTKHLSATKGVFMDYSKIQGSCPSEAILTTWYLESCLCGSSIVNERIQDGGDKLRSSEGIDRDCAFLDDDNSRDLMEDEDGSSGGFGNNSFFRGGAEDSQNTGEYGTHQRDDGNCLQTKVMSPRSTKRAVVNERVCIWTSNRKSATGAQLLASSGNKHAALNGRATDELARRTKMIKMDINITADPCYSSLLLPRASKRQANYPPEDLLECPQHSPFTASSSVALNFHGPLGPMNEATCSQLETNTTRGPQMLGGFANFQRSSCSGKDSQHYVAMQLTKIVPAAHHQPSTRQNLQFKETDFHMEARKAAQHLRHIKGSLRSFSGRNLEIAVGITDSQAAALAAVTNTKGEVGLLNQLIGIAEELKEFAFGWLDAGPEERTTAVVGRRQAAPLQH